jgi:uncharacterized membrane-anchored protein
MLIKDASITEWIATSPAAPRNDDWQPAAPRNDDWQPAAPRNDTGTLDASLRWHDKS